MNNDHHITQRKIIHIDMDAFFASIEQRDFSQYRHKPIAVGGEGARGVVAAASYEARKFGVYSAMSSRIARQKCPDLIFVNPRFEIYKSVSAEIMTIFQEFTDLVEPLSLDEAYLDVTENKKGIRSATYIARDIKALIKSRTRLTASAGISINKFLAKVASDLEKPDGLTVIKPDEVHRFLEELPIDKFFGVGLVTAAKMKALGIFNGNDLLKLSQFDLYRRFGKMGSYLYQVVRGEDNRPVTPERIRKSSGAERTFTEDIIQVKKQHANLKLICDDLAQRLMKSNIYGKTVTLKVRYHDFELKTRSKRLSHYVCNSDELLDISKELLKSDDLPRKAVRLFGISLSNLNTEENPELTGQLTLEF